MTMAMARKRKAAPGDAAVQRTPARVEATQVACCLDACKETEGGASDPRWRESCHCGVFGCLGAPDADSGEDERWCERDHACGSDREPEVGGGEAGGSGGEDTSRAVAIAVVPGGDAHERGSDVVPDVQQDRELRRTVITAAWIEQL